MWLVRNCLKAKMTFKNIEYQGAKLVIRSNEVIDLDKIAGGRKKAAQSKTIQTALKEGYLESIELQNEQKLKPHSDDFTIEPAGDFESSPIENLDSPNDIEEQEDIVPEKSLIVNDKPGNFIKSSEVIDEKLNNHIHDEVNSDVDHIEETLPEKEISPIKPIVNQVSKTVPEEIDILHSNIKNKMFDSLDDSLSKKIESEPTPIAYDKIQTSHIENNTSGSQSENFLSQFKAKQKDKKTDSVSFLDQISNYVELPPKVSENQHEVNEGRYIEQQINHEIKKDGQSNANSLAEDENSSGSIPKDKQQDIVRTIQDQVGEILQIKDEFQNVTHVEGNEIQNVIGEKLDQINDKFNNLFQKMENYEKNNDANHVSEKSIHTIEEKLETLLTDSDLNRQVFDKLSKEIASRQGQRVAKKRNQDSELQAKLKFLDNPQNQKEVNSNLTTLGRETKVKKHKNSIDIIDPTELDFY